MEAPAKLHVVPPDWAVDVNAVLAEMEATSGRFGIWEPVLTMAVMGRFHADNPDLFRFTLRQVVERLLISNAAEGQAQ